MAENSNNDSNTSDGTSYGQIISNSQSTVTLASALVDLVGRPLSDLWAKRSAATSYRRKLGEWAAEASDESSRWLQPVLSSKALEDHLVREEGHLKPSGTCEASLAWAQLLYALNIRPGMGILAWRLPPKMVDPNKEGINLLIDGAAMCHIVNLFRIYDDPAPLCLSQIEPTTDQFAIKSRRWYHPGKGILAQVDIQENICRFPFGTMSFNYTPTAYPHQINFVTNFEPGSLEDLKKTNVPFYCDTGDASGFAMELEKSTLMAKYFAGVHNQVPITDTTSIGSPPARNETLKKRVQYYMSNIRLLQSYHECESRCSKLYTGPVIGKMSEEHHSKVCDLRGKVDWSKPRVVTRVWLDEIEHIKRRVTSNGGDGMELLDAMITSLEKTPSYNRFLQSISDSFGRIKISLDECIEAVRYLLKQRLMFADQKIEIFWRISLVSRRYLFAELHDIIVAELPHILVDLIEHPGSTWIHNLSTVGKELGSMINGYDMYSGVPVIVLELGPHHMFWKSMFEVKGE